MKWFFVAFRLALLLLGFLMGTRMPLSTPSTTWIAPFLTALLGLAAAPANLLLSRIISPTAIWRAPSWFDNPFNRVQPLQWFHASAFATAAAGIGVMTNASTDARLMPQGVALAAFGVGMLAGVLISPRLNAWREPR